MTKNREDIAVLKKALQFYSWTGTHPCIEKYILMIMIPFHIVGIIFYAKLYYYSLTRFNIHFIGIVLYFLNFLALILFNYICLKTTYSGAMLWNDLLKKIDDFDIKMKGQRNFNEETVCRYLLKNCVVFICYIAQYFVYILMNNVTDYQQIIGISYLCFIDIQIFVTTTTLVKFLNILVKRYDCFKTKIGDVYLTTQSDINFWSGKNLESSYLLLIDIIRKINKVYGGRIFVIVIKTFLYVLGCFQLLLSGHSRNGLQDIAILLHSVVQMFILLVSMQKYNLIYVNGQNGSKTFCTLQTLTTD